MRIAPISNNQQQSFKARVKIEENAQVVFRRYGLIFEDSLDAMLKPLRRSNLAGSAFVSANKRTRNGVQFHIGADITTRKGFKSSHTYVSIPDNLNYIQKAMKLANAVFKPFLQSAERNANTKIPIKAA